MGQFSDALNNDLVTVVDADEGSRTFRVRIGVLRTIVTIDVADRPTRGRYRYTASHAIHTPEQLAPYYTSVPFGDTPGGALSKALSDFTTFYSVAVRLGHRPADQWLVRR